MRWRIQLSINVLPPLSLLHSSTKPRLDHVGMTSLLGPRTKSDVEERIVFTTCSFSCGWIEHVEYTTFLALGTVVQVG